MPNERPPHFAVFPDMRRFVLILIVAGCHKHAAVKAPTTAAQPVQPAPAATAKVEQPQPASPNLAVSDDLARQCSLQLDSSDKAPKFDFDRAELLPEDRDLLERVATCFTSGPLRGKHLQLIGHADPRGTDEYNLGLGTQRAHSVRDYLEHLGVAATQLAETTRGALDAHGHDEATWRVDRRVDLDLVR